MRFPSSVLLSISYTNSLINLFFMTVIIGLISLAGRYSSPVYFLGLLYFLVASVALIFAITLVMSTLIILVRDFRSVLQNLIRMGFFLTPVFWQAGERGGLLQMVSDLNPFAYLVQTFRNALIYGDGFFYGDGIDHLYFWSITLFLLITGSYLHMQFRYKLIDYLLRWYFHAEISADLQCVCDRGEGLRQRIPAQARQVLSEGGPRCARHRHHDESAEG